jgi:predicted ATPase
VYLKTLGRLALDGVDFPRPKLLLLLAYLAIEGSKEKRHLYELFWHNASDPATSLRMALQQFRKVAPDLVVATERSVSTSIAHDLTQLHSVLAQADPNKLEAFYPGAFLQDFTLPDWNAELEEWVYSTREAISQKVCGVYLVAAEQHASLGAFALAAQWAEKAFLTGKQELLPENLARLYPLLLSGESWLAPEIKKQLEGFGLEPSLTRDQARAQFFAVSEQKPKPIAHNLPRAKTSFVGRDPELLELERLLCQSEVLLVTLLGMGGIGKTRLALQLANQQLQEQNFPDGVYFVPLESLTEAPQILLALAQTLGVSVQENPFDSVVAGIGNQHMLLVLDNFEHLTEAALLVSELLTQCPHLRIVVTSRERLSLEEEHVLPLQGLPLPFSVSFVDAEYVDSIRLFVQRAKRTRLDFDLTPENLPHVLEICRLVEGSPLGIELAAVWLASLSVAEIAREIGQNISLLETGSRNIAGRHQSLRAVFEHSWKLLKPKEQRILALLSVFRGGFTRQAASSIADTNLGLLSALVGKSVLRVAEPEGRYDFHPLLLEYASEKLLGLGELLPTRSQHAQYFLGLVNASSQDNLQAQIKTCRAEYKNLLAALAWSQENQQWLYGLQLSLLLGALWQSQGYNNEGIHWLKTMLSHPEAATASLERVKALLLLSRLASLNSEHAQLALETGQESLALAQILQAKEEIVQAHLNFSLIAQKQNDWQAMQDHGQMGLSLARQLEDPKLTANALWIVGGNLAIVTGDYVGGRKYLEESLSLNRRFGSRRDMGMSLNNLGFLVFLLGDLQAAKTYLEESICIAEELPDPYLASVAQDSLSAVLQDLGELESAYLLAEKSLHYSWQIKNTINIRNSLENFAGLAVLQGQPKRAAMLWGAAERFQPEDNSGITLLWHERNQRFMSTSKARLGESGFQAGWKTGKAMKLEEAVHFALKATALV